MDLSRLPGAGLIARHPYLPLWLFVVVVGLLLRPLTPIDETRVVTVAWEMWQRHDFLVPYVNGEPYSHKPPLLQWAIHLGWLLFGVNDWTPRLVAPLFGLGSLILLEKLARRLWPLQETVARLAPLLLLGTLCWAFWATLTMYDLLMGFFVLATLHGLLDLIRGRSGEGLLWLGLAVAGALLSKGPVIFVFLLPTALSAPWWSEKRPTQGWTRYYLALAGGIVMGILLALAWALPAASTGGEAYGQAILWGQFAGRVAHSFAHNRPWWWYAPVLPMMLLPWVGWPALWRSTARLSLDHGLRFCLSQVLPALVIFSIISGKQVHYLLPLFPAITLMGARALDASPLVGSARPLWGLGLLFLLLAASPWLAQASHDLVGFPKDGSDALDLLSRLSGTWQVAMALLGLALLVWRRALLPLPSVTAMAAAGSGLLFAMIHWAFYQTSYAQWDVTAFAQRVAALQQAGLPIAHNGDYHGDFHFLGRLTRPLEIAQGPVAVEQWSQAHPNGYVIGRFEVGRPSYPPGDKAETVQDYRGRKLALWQAAAIIPPPQPPTPASIAPPVEKPAASAPQKRPATKTNAPTNTKASKAHSKPGQRTRKPTKP